jgi:AcrR family transcriptional regulator
MDKTQNQSVQKRKRGVETTRQILEVSAALFARNGYDGVSVRTIASQAGIKESSLYNHFQGKEDILETLYDEFIVRVPATRPTDAEIDQMLLFMGPEDVFRQIAFHVGKSVNGILSNTAIIINYEKFRNKRAAEIYYTHIVREPVDYYVRLINKMIERNMIKHVDARIIAEQYNYVSLSLTNEYIMSQYGLADEQAVVGFMIKTLKFFCSLMDKGDDQEEDKGERHEEKEAQTPEG